MQVRSYNSESVMQKEFQVAVSAWVVNRLLIAIVSKCRYAENRPKQQQK